MTVNGQLKDIAELTDNWNSNNAKSFSKDHLLQARNLGVLLTIFLNVPIILPTARESIQFEYELNDVYIELELYKGGSIYVLLTKGEVLHSHSIIPIEYVFDVISEFKMLCVE